MLLRQRLLALQALLSFFAAAASPSYAWERPLDAKTKGLAHYIMAVCYDLNDQESQAVSEYQKSVKYNGSEIAPRLKLGTYYLRNNEILKAQRQLQAVTRLFPQESQAHYLLALIYSSEHQYNLAAEEYEMILKTAAKNNPANTDAYMYLGQLYYAQEKYSQAAEQFLTGPFHFEPNNTSAVFLLGSVWADSNQHAKAIDAFRQVLESDPENSEALNSLGYVYAEDGIHLNEAIRMIRKALEIDPTNGAYYDSLGWAFYKKGQYAESLMVLQKAGNYITDEILYDHMGDVYQSLKDDRRACQYWQKSLDLEPHQPLVQEKIRKLEKCVASQSTRRLN